MEAALSYYLDDKILIKKNTLFRMMTKKQNEIKANAELLQKELLKYNINSTVVEGKGQCGGGALPGKDIESFAVRIDGNFKSNKKKSEFAEKLYYGLLHFKTPVVGILRKGDIYFDLLTIPDGQVGELAQIIGDVFSSTEKHI